MTKLARLPGMWLLVLLLAATGEISVVSSSSNQYHQEDGGASLLEKKNNLRRAQIFRRQRVRVVIVGAGAAGLGAARELEANGITDYVILEADNQIGGRTKKDTTFVGYPLDKGASFIPDRFLQEMQQIAGRQLPTASVPGIIRVFRDYTYYDFFRDHVKPPDQYIKTNCQVRQVDYQDTEIQVACADGRRFVADQAVITVPLSVLQSDDIAFTPPLGALAGNSRDWWGGFKIFIEFENKFYGDYFCVWEPCTTENGENLFWDYTYSAPSRSAASNLLAGYIVGDFVERFGGRTERQMLDMLLQEIANRFTGGSTRDLGYRRHTLVNWSQEPFIRGTYSSWSSNLATGVSVVNNQLFFAGEAFPVNGEERGWVFSAFHSGMGAATQVAALPPPSPDRPQLPAPLETEAGTPESPSPPDRDPLPAPLEEETGPLLNQMRFDIMYDKAPSATYWVIIDLSSGRPVYESRRDSSSRPNNWGLASTTLGLRDGNYYFTVFDSAVNGRCCSNEIGNIELVRIGNGGADKTLVSLPGNFGYIAYYGFSLP